MWLRIIVLTMLVQVCSLLSFAQAESSFAAAGDSLFALSDTIWKCRTDSSRLAANTIFIDRFEKVLKQPGAFNYPFDTLKGISKLRSEDGRFRIITWNIPLNNGTFRYFGFIELQGDTLFRLQETENGRAGLMNDVLPATNWYGVLYYSLIVTRFEKKSYYTLLGWDGNDPSSNRKVVDILSFDDKGLPVFGAPLFKTKNGLRNRVVIEYAKNGNAILRYDRQTLLEQKGKRIKERKEWMIVTDRLVPMNPSLEGMWKYYVPAGDTYDAYIFREGFWMFVEDIRVTNPPVQ